MSEENVEIVRRAIEAWNRRDLTAMSALWHSDGEIDWSHAQGPLKGVHRGRGGRESFSDEFFSTFENVQVEAHDFTEAGSEVVVSNTAHARGRDGIEVTAQSSFVFMVENGQALAFECSKSKPRPSEPSGCRSRALTSVLVSG